MTMKQLHVSITTQSPLVITAESSSRVLTESRDYISGTIVRGILADAYRKARNLGNTAHEDSSFKQLFLGGLQFQAAYPMVKGHRSYPLPQSLMKHKVEGDIKDMLEADGAAGYKVLKGLGTVYEGQVDLASVHKKIYFHMSRNSADERFAGRSNGGGIYNYEAIGEGQTFAAIITGEEEDLITLVRDLKLKNNTMTVRAGKSKRTSYGKCEVIFGDVVPCEMKNISDWVEQLKHGILALRLDSPFISDRPVSGWRRLEEESLADDFVGALRRVLPEKELTLSKVFTGAEIVRNYVGVWQLYRPEVLALAAGSVCVLTCSTDWSDEDIKRLTDVLATGIGVRKAEGFGQIRPWVLRSTLELQNTEEEPVPVAPVKSLSKVTKKLVKSILKTKDVDAIRSRAYLDVQKHTKELKKADNHTFARLENYVPLLGGQRGGLNKDDSEALRRIFGDNWKANGLSVGHKELGISHDVLELLEDRKVPKWIDTICNTHDGLRTLVGSSMSAEDRFIEYWTWFFKYARKL